MIQSVSVRNLWKLSSCTFTEVARIPHGKKKKERERDNTSLFLRCGIVEGHSHKNICAEKKYDKNILLKAP